MPRLKWTDNVLSQHDVPDVVSARRGVARRIPHTALLHLALIRELHADLGLSVRDALGLARQFLAPDGDGEAWRGSVRDPVRSCIARALARPAVARRARVRACVAPRSAAESPRGEGRRLTK